jgi:Leucine-rich repeat (LRR) protein
MQASVGRYPGLTDLEVMYEHKSGREARKAVSNELCAILRCVEHAALLQKQRNLKDLTVRFRPPRHAVREEVKRACLDLARSTVRAIDLSYNRLRDDGAALLAGALRNNHWNTALDLSGNDIVGDAAALALAEAVHSMPELVRLNMSHNRIATTKALDALGASLKGNTVLTDLNMSANKIKDIRGFANGLGANGTLTSLHIGCNEIPVENMNEIIALVEAKPAMKLLCAVPFRDTTIAELDVSRRSLGVEGAIVVRRYLENNGALVTLLMANNRMATKEAGEALGQALAQNSVLKELDISSNAWKYDSYDSVHADGPGFATGIADGIKNNGEMTSLNISSNNLTQGALKPGKSGAYASHYEMDMTGNRSGSSESDLTVPFFVGVIALADGIKNSEALTSLNISTNRMATKEAGKAIADALAVNSCIQELDVSSNNWYDGDLITNYDKPLGDGPGFAKELAVGLSANGALVKFDISKNEIAPEGGKALAEVLKGNNIIKELNMASNNLSDDGEDMTGIIAVANAIPTMGALVSVNILKNYIGVEQANILAGILKEHPTLMSLCGNTGNETKLNMSGKMDGAQDAIMLAPEVAANGALVSANLLNNDIGTEQAHHLVSIMKEHPTLKSLCGITGDETKLDMSYMEMGADDAIMLAPEIVANGALTSLNVSKNALCGIDEYGDGTYAASGVTALADAIKKHQ